MLSLLLVGCAAPQSDDGKEHTTEVKKNVIQTPAPYSDVKVYHYKLRDMTISYTEFQEVMLLV